MKKTMQIQQSGMNYVNTKIWNELCKCFKLKSCHIIHSQATMQGMCTWQFFLYHTYWMSYNCLKLEVPLELWVNVIIICVGHNSSTFGLTLYEEQPSTTMSWHHLRKNMCWIWKRKTKASSNSCNKCRKFVSKNLASSRLQIGLLLLIVR